jgi:hypothetical protein
MPRRTTTPRATAYAASGTASSPRVGPAGEVREEHFGDWRTGNTR